jgi:hypothetical protein
MDIILAERSWFDFVNAHDRLASAAQPKSVSAPRPKRCATETKEKLVAPAKSAKRAKPKRKTEFVAPTKRAPNTTRPMPRKAAPKGKTKRAVPTKPVSKTKTKPVAPAKPKVKRVPIGAPTKGAKAFVAAAKSPASQTKMSAAKAMRLAGPGLRCLANHQLRRSATGSLYCAICDR